jgi:hypothetical protein
MGAAAARARENERLDAEGIARPRDPWCPACRSRRIIDMPREQFPMVDLDCDWQGCLDCKAIWEPFPEVYVRDPVCAAPCDNCAFRPGSPEQRDPARWAELMASFRGSDNYEGVPGRFYCHKNTPIDLEHGPGNFKFPRKPVRMNGHVLRNADGSAVMDFDVAKLRACSGWLRMMWARDDKRRVA